MAKDHSFDVVNELEISDLINAVDQTGKELLNRYDFKGVDAGLQLNDSRDAITVFAPSEYQIDQIIEILRKKLANVGIDQRVLDTSQDYQNNVNIKKVVPIKSGISAIEAKRLSKVVRDTIPKVKVAIQGQELRVTSPKIDELQSAMQLLKKHSNDTPLQFRNMR